MKNSKSALIKGNNGGVFGGGGGDSHGSRKAQAHSAKTENPEEMKVGNMSKGP